MGSKVKCPACGAKNDATSYRCRMCTVVINPEAAAAIAAEPAAEAPPTADHFDAGVIDRQLQPTRSKFGDDAGGLAARLAAARAAKATNQPGSTPATGADAPVVPALGDPPTPESWSSQPPADSWSSAPPPDRSGAPPAASPGATESEGFVPVDLSEMQARTAPPTAPPIEHEAEPFDPDALFRDMS